MSKQTKNTCMYRTLCDLTLCDNCDVWEDINDPKSHNINTVIHTDESGFCDASLLTRLRYLFLGWLTAKEIYGKEVINCEVV